MSTVDSKKHLDCADMADVPNGVFKAPPWFGSLMSSGRCGTQCTTVRVGHLEIVGGENFEGAAAGARWRNPSKSVGCWQW